MDKLTRELNQISSLLAEAQRAGDSTQVISCINALDGDTVAIVQCLLVIQAATRREEER